MDISKQEFTAAEIMEICKLQSSVFYTLKAAGKIPPADDTKRQPHVWYRSTILTYIEKRLKWLAENNKLAPK